jgi:flagellar biosynthesis/type III secretory pathway protein FliH
MSNTSAVNQLALQLILKGITIPEGLLKKALADEELNILTASEWSYDRGFSDGHEFGSSQTYLDAFDKGFANGYHKGSNEAKERVENWLSEAIAEFNTESILTERLDSGELTTEQEAEAISAYNQLNQSK